MTVLLPHNALSTGISSSFNPLPAKLKDNILSLNSISSCYICSGCQLNKKHCKNFRTIVPLLLSARFLPLNLNIIFILIGCGRLFDRKPVFCSIFNLHYHDFIKHQQQGI
ncbi:MAG TPA: hypothetical protein DCO83_16960 [Mucilaginibacter sp.]|nr:hypothetical protein [Mucilaginibacter sp.]